MLWLMQMLENKQIKDPEVANIAAYAAYPYEDTAHTLEKYHLDDLAAEQYAKVDEASVNALAAWVQRSKNDEYLDGGDPRETERRRLAVAEALPSFSTATEAAELEPSESKELPEIKGVGEELVSRVVGYILTHDQDTPIFMRKIAEDLGGENPSKISRAVAQMTEMGYIDQESKLDFAHRPYKKLQPTEKLKSDANEFETWRDKVELFELAKQFGLSDIETERYLVKLGRAMFLNRNN